MLPPAGLGAAAGEAAVVTTPTGAPSNGSLYRHGGNKIGVQWTNGDASSGTEVRYTDTVGGSCPASPIEDNTTFKGKPGPGVTMFETSDADSDEQCSYFIAHYKGGTYSAWHQVVVVLDAGSCVSCG